MTQLLDRLIAKAIFLTFAAAVVYVGVEEYSSRQLAAGNQKQTLTAATREAAYRANNVGVALLEQFKYKEGTDSFKHSLQLDPKLSLARINLAIALYNVPDLPAAEREAEAASALMPDAPQPYYMIGLIAKSQSRADAAIGAFQRVLKIDPNDVGTNVNLGQIYSQQRKYPDAIAAFRTALAAEPYNGTALYNLGTVLLRAGQRDEGQRVIQKFQELRQRGSGTTLGNNYLEQGRYAEAIASTGAEAELVDRTTPSIKFTDATASFFTTVAPTETQTTTTAAPIFGSHFNSGDPKDFKDRITAAFAGAVALFDYDGDHDLDLFLAKGTEQHLYRNDGGKFVDVTSQSQAFTTKSADTIVGVVAGDYDNDGRPDLFVMRAGSLALYHNDGGGKFTDVSSAAGIPAYPYLPGACAFVDIDHDGDLDLFVAGLADLTKPAQGAQPVFPDDFATAPTLLLRNDGNGKFTDITKSAKLDASAHAVAVIPTDFNNRRDIDLMIVNYAQPPKLFSNQRDGTFRNVTNEVGLQVSGNWTCAAAADVNKDGYTDFFFGRSDGPGLFALSDGREKFKTVPAPDTSRNARASQFLDYDNDGLIDCVLLTDTGGHILRNLGNEWGDVTAQAFAPDQTKLGANLSRFIASADLDNDGDTDLLFLTSSGNVRVERNDASLINRSLRIDLAGKVSNRSGIGSKVEMRAGSLVQKLESYSAFPAPAPAEIIFGLGQRDSVDAVRVLWPAGIVQAETEIVRPGNPKSVALSLSVTELDRKPSSCPFLFAWNGERFEFITDFMGGGEMGYLEEPGRHNKPDPDEYVRISSEQLKERNGLCELRVTNELEEALFADQFQLLAVDHPLDTDIYPNEGMTDPPRRFKVFVTRAAHPPLRAVDERGNDVTDRISKLDRTYPDDFALHRIRGYADQHALILTLDKERKALSRTLLLLTGWTDYAWSSDNVAASQSDQKMMPPELQVRDSQGKWRTVIPDIGIPVGRPQTVTVDLTGKFLSSSREVRIITNMRIYWDQILVDSSDDRSPLITTRLNLTGAELHWRGFSREISPDGREPWSYDYNRISFTSPWKVMTGNYTREGDVRELLINSDDMFVIARPGDEISLSFDARRLPVLRNGWTRDFLLYSDGFSKEMDINSASPDQLAPMPFHGMSRYPYEWPERYPLKPQRLAYMKKYNTRFVGSQFSSIDTLLYTR